MQQLPDLAVGESLHFRLTHLHPVGRTPCQGHGGCPLTDHHTQLHRRNWAHPIAHPLPGEIGHRAQNPEIGDMACLERPFRQGIERGRFIGTALLTTHALCRDIPKEIGAIHLIGIPQRTADLLLDSSQGSVSVVLYLVAHRITGGRITFIAHLQRLLPRLRIHDGTALLRAVAHHREIEGLRSGLERATLRLHAGGYLCLPSRVNDRLAANRLPTRSVGDHHARRSARRIHQGIRHQAAIQEIDPMVDQLILQSLLDLQGGRTLAVTEQPLRQGGVQNLVRQAVIQVRSTDVLP